MKRVLLLSPFFYPEKISTGKYNTNLAECLVQHGSPTVVVASHPVFPSWKPSFSDDVMPGVDIIRGGLNIRYPKSQLLRRAVLEIWYAFHVLKAIVFGKVKFDTVVPIFPPSLFFFVLSWFLKGSKRCVGVVHDLQGVYAAGSKGVLSGIVGRLIRYIEKRCFARCDRLVFLSQSMRQRAIDDYQLDPAKCSVRYPFVSVKMESSEGSEALRDFFPEGKIHVVYSGALGDKQNPFELIKFFIALTERNADYACHVFSAGPHFDALKSQYSESSGVYFHDLVPAEHVAELYRRSDVQVIPQLFGTGDGSLPSKLPNLLASGVPIFVVCEEGSEVGELVRESTSGFVAHSWDPAEMAASLENWQQQKSNESRAVRVDRLSRFVNERFSLEGVVEEIVNG